MRGAPLRVERHAEEKALGPETAGAAPSGFEKWATAVAKLVPGEVVAAYLAGRSILQQPPPSSISWWLLLSGVCLLAVIGLRKWMTSDKAAGVPAEWSNVVVAAVSFVIWVYSFGDVFAMLGYWDEKGSALILILWTLLAPLALVGLKKVFRE